MPKTRKKSMKTKTEKESGEKAIMERKKEKKSGETAILKTRKETETKKEKQKKRQSPRQRKKEKETETEKEKDVIVPDDLIVNILSRLPVKILVRFKCVSKSWPKLIGGSYTAKMHLIRSGVRKHVFCLESDKFESPSRVKPRLVVYSIDNMNYEPNAICFGRPLLCDSVHVMGYCNGLVLLVTAPIRLYLLNPSTREINELPKSPSTWLSSISYGFGYDASEDDYKVVEITTSFGRTRTIIRVYTLKTSCWEVIEDCEISMVDIWGVFNGALHWLRKDNIGLLHFGDKRVEYLFLTDLGESSEPCFIGGLGGCLCVTARCGPDMEFTEVWLMKEYGLRESWTKVAVIPFPEVELLDFSNNDEILFRMGLSLFTYNMETNISRKKAEIGSVKVGIYHESVISPHHHT